MTVSFALAHGSFGNTQQASDPAADCLVSCFGLKGPGVCLFSWECLVMFDVFYYSIFLKEVF